MENCILGKCYFCGEPTKSWKFKMTIKKEKIKVKLRKKNGEVVEVPAVRLTRVRGNSERDGVKRS